MTFSFAHLGVLMTVLAVSACGTREVMLERSAERIGTRITQYDDRFGVCWPFELDRVVTGTAPPLGEEGEVVAGFHNHVKRGQTCHTQDSTAYHGLFFFDLSDLRGDLVVAATLRLERRNTPVLVNVERRVPSGVIRETHCALRLRVATEPLSAGTSFGEVAAVNLRRSGVQQDRSTVGIEVGVTREVQGWVQGRRENFGFVLSPEEGAIDKNENTCTGYWFNPRLEIRVLRSADREP